MEALFADPPCKNQTSAKAVDMLNTQQVETKRRMLRIVE
jgi:hypothetical protein